MKSLQDIVRIINERKEQLRKDYRIKSVKIFGSYAEGKQKEMSDLDLIIEFEELPTLIELVRMEEGFEKMLGVLIF